MRDTGQEKRAFLAIVLAMGVLLLWNVFFPPPSPPESAPRSAAPGETAPEPVDVATAPAPESSADAGSAAAMPPAEVDASPLAGAGPLERAEGAEAPPAARIHVEGDRAHLTLDSMGARVTGVALPHYSATNGDEVELLPPGAGALGTVIVTAADTLRLDAQPFRLVSDTQDGDGRRITWELALRGLELRKTYVIPEHGRLFHVEQELVRDDLGVRAWGLSWAGGLGVTEHVVSRQGGQYFEGTVMAEGKVQRKKAPDLRKGALVFPGQTYFMGLQNKYFLAAIVPQGENQGPSRLWQVPSGDPHLPGIAGEILVERATSLASNRVGYDVYVGPQDYKQLAALGLRLEESIDLGAGWIRPLSRVILHVLIAIHDVVPNYGVTIILFSTLMNLLFFPLTYRSTKSMRMMSALKPQLDALKEKYKDEPQKLSEATMRVYKEAGVNPLAGCLPILVQMPIFFALYAVLIRTIELRQAPFMLWIHDLSQPDVIFHLPFELPFIGSGVCLLPIVMGITSYFQSKQTMVDPSQKMMLILMPIMMTFIFFTMPSGLVLYWLTGNVFTIVSKYFFKDPVLVPAAATEPAGKAPGGGGRRAAKAGARR